MWSSQQKLVFIHGEIDPLTGTNHLTFFEREVPVFRH